MNSEFHRSPEVASARLRPPVGRRILQRKCACGGTPGPTGECTGCRRKHVLGQPKLTVNQPGDRYEQEADRVAEQVMRMPEPHLQRQVRPEEEEEELLQAKPLAGPITPLVQRQVEEEEEEDLLQPKLTVQRQVGADGGATASPVVHDVLRGPGQPLDAKTRAFMEPRFGHDFSRVRVHADAKAAESARAVQAQAYTVGRNVVFGAGQYAPGTDAGRRLLAHELTHVVQQGGGQVQRAQAKGVAQGGHTIRQHGQSNLNQHDAEDQGRLQQRSIKQIDSDALDVDLIGSRGITGSYGSAPVISCAEPGVMRQFIHPRSRYVDCSELRLPIPRDQESFQTAVQSHLRFCVQSRSLGAGGVPVRREIELGSISTNASLEAVWSELSHFSAGRGAIIDIIYHGTSNVSRVEYQLSSPTPDPTPDPPTETEETSEEPEVEETKKFCGPDITQWLIRQMTTNQSDSRVTSMAQRNRDDITGLDLGALYDWYQLVATGAEWDLKTVLGSSINGRSPCRQNCVGRLYSVTLDGECMTYEVAANIHFGYIGRWAGFTENRLLSGASRAQASEGRGETTDDPRDVQAIRKGFELFNARSPAGLTRAGLESNYYHRLPAGDGDPAGCGACTTSLPSSP